MTSQMLASSKSRISSNSSSRQRSSGNGTSQLDAKDQKYSLQLSGQIEHMQQKQVRSNHGPSSNQQQHKYQQSVQIMNSKSGTGGVAFNPITLLLNNQRDGRKPGSVNLGNNRDFQQQISRRHQQANNTNSNEARPAQDFANQQQLLFVQNAVVGRNNPPDSNIALQSQKMQYRGKFQNSFLANNKTKTQADKGEINMRLAGGNYSVSPPREQTDQDPPKPNRIHPPHNVKLVNKSPMCISNPSTFTISTTTANNNNNGMISPNISGNNPGSAGSHVHRLSGSSGSNHFSVQHNSTRQSDIMLATDQSSIKQRDNIKVFSFKPGNLTETASQAKNAAAKPKQLNVQSLKTSHLSREQQASIYKAVTKVSSTTGHTTQPSPTNLAPGATKLRNRSSGSGSGKQSQTIIASNLQKHPSPDGTVSNESKGHKIVMQPNIVKKPLMTNYSREDSMEALDHSPDPCSQPSVLIKKKENLQQPVPTSQQSTAKRVKSASRHSTGAPSSCREEQTAVRVAVNTEASQEGAIQAKSTEYEKINMKKRGHSEHTEGSNLLATPVPVTSTVKKQILKGGFTLQQRGNSLQPSSVADELNKKLNALNQLQDANNNRPSKKHVVDHKEVIVNHIRKYIKVKPQQENSTTLRDGVSGEKTELIIQNLRDFLTYLEQKNIINPQKLSDQTEMKNLIKDIMKLDLSKFSKPRTNSQPRETQHQPQQSSKTDPSIQMKKRKVMTSPATHTQIDQGSAPTQFSGTQSSQHSIIQVMHHQKKSMGKEPSRTKTTSMETSPIPATTNKYEYVSQPKYMNYTKQQKSIKTTSGQRSRDNSASTEAAIKVNMSSVNFVLPSNRQISNRNKTSKDEGNSLSCSTQNLNTDVYGVKQMQKFLMQSSQNSPESRYEYLNTSGKFKTDFSSSNLDAIQPKPASIKIQTSGTTIVNQKKKKIRYSTSKEAAKEEQIALEPHLQQLKQSKPGLHNIAGRGSKTAGPSTTQQSPRESYPKQKLANHVDGLSNQPIYAHQKVLSQPSLASNTSVHDPLVNQQQVPTIQLMINTNGQGKFLGINVNNYCFAPQHPTNNTSKPQEDQTRQHHQLVQMQNNNSAEQLLRAQNVGLLQKTHQGGVKTEPDQQDDTSKHSHQYKSSQQQQQQLVSSSTLLQNFIRQQQIKTGQSKDFNTRLQNSNEYGSSEFQIAQSPERLKESQKRSNYYEDLNSKNQPRRKDHDRGVMIIQDEDDDNENTGGNGAEAKMSPMSTNVEVNNIFHGGHKQAQQDTPLVAKLNSKRQSTNRGDSGHSSQRNSSLTKALADLTKSQIQAGLFGGKQLRPTPQENKSKESSQERAVTSVAEKLTAIQQPQQSRDSQRQQLALKVIQQTTAAPITNLVTNNQLSATQTPINDASSKQDSSAIVLNDSITNDREKLIQYIKAHVKKHNTIPHTTLDFYKFVKLLGKGAFGKITLGIHKLTGKYVAIKSIDKVNIKDEYSRRKVFQEVYILKKIRHSCVIRLLEVFESEKHFLMVMEYSGGGDLLQYVKKRKRLNEQSAKAIFKQILYALGHCHCRSVLHRDMKLDNVLMDGEGGVKLCDFGVSRLVKKGQTINEQCGTPAYLAPEIILDQGYQGFSADIWSLGVLLYAMVQGTVPFKANNITDLHKLILKGEFEFPVDTVSAEVKDLIRKMLVLDTNLRISIPQMLNHPWVQDMQKEASELGHFEDEEQNLRVGSTFFREEVLGGLISGYKSDGNENGNINFVNVENLYYRGGVPQKEPNTNPDEKVTYSDYCALTEDFMTYRIDEEAMDIVTGFGYPRQLVIQSINRGDVNHATAAYYLRVY